MCPSFTLLGSGLANLGLVQLRARLRPLVSVCGLTSAVYLWATDGTRGFGTLLPIRHPFYRRLLYLVSCSRRLRALFRVLSIFSIVSALAGDVDYAVLLSCGPMCDLFHSFNHSFFVCFDTLFIHVVTRFGNFSPVRVPKWSAVCRCPVLEVLYSLSTVYHDGVPTLYSGLMKLVGCHTNGFKKLYLGENDITLYLNGIMGAWLFHALRVLESNFACVFVKE